MKTDLDMLAEIYSDPMYAIDTIGSVDELGYFALIEFGDYYEQTSVFRDAKGYDPDDTYAAGWYIAYTDSVGFIFTSPYASEDDALKRWDEIVGKYDEYWRRKDEYESTNGYEDVI